MMSTYNCNYKDALGVALRYVQYGDRTEREVRQRLIRDDFSEDIIDEVIRCLTEEKFINDRRYAEYYVECYSSKRSRRRIEYDLRGKGIEESIISEVTEDCDDMQAASAAFAKQLSSRGLDLFSYISPNDCGKISAALYRQGFDGGIIRCFMDKINKNID